MRVAAKLRRVIRDSEWTQKKLAEVTNTPEKTISALVNDKKRLTPHTATKLGTVLGFDPTEMLVAQIEQSISDYEAAHPGTIAGIRERLAQLHLEQNDEELSGISENDSVASAESEEAPPAATL